MGSSSEEEHNLSPRRTRQTRQGRQEPGASSSEEEHNLSPRRTRQELLHQGHQEPPPQRKSTTSALVGLVRSSFVGVIRSLLPRGRAQPQLFNHTSPRKKQSHVSCQTQPKVEPLTQP